ncbi:MAG: Grx4 family monothiol glutaredoxin [Proteobacteria bacterium]|nr:Grx4 family monothiol glutaredoxin [Pseudomonadota bacterium]
MEVMEHIKQAIESNSIILFMKGTPEFPQCGFSSRSSQALAECGAEFAFINVLAEPEVRENLHRYANWPTFPQLYINGDLVGGCDIIMEMFENGDLQTLVDQASK